MSDFFEYKFYTRDKLHCDQFLYNNKTIEYNVNDPKDRNHALNELKQLIGESIDFALKDKSCADDDEFLLRFLFARNFVISDAFKLLVNYHSFKQRNVNILSKISALDEGIQLALRDGFPTIIPQRDRKGRKILILFAANWNPIAYSLITVFRALLLSMEKLLEDIQNQANGFVLIVDWTNFTYKQTGNLQLKVIKIMIEGLQDCFPAKFKEVHFVGQPWYVEATLTVIRPFLQEETRENLFMHGANLSTLHDSIAKDVLPTEMGGETKSINPLDWVHILLESSQNPTECQRYRFTQSTNYTQTPKACTSK
ncbi:clavesin-2-like [Contarinia nasturtii]|uniref:clavesin-2-like n=1 Tax=Contarinia nasturtii TaxID=265458 RepID=UPI0012D3F429|nr:clavesin-2-like [Contarinia nasturtii]XP_031628532.1 clavesin-2-like [Contarinia nasturtii]XP_031628533.1 clavesin-2-like [Contarinia nasturtii]